MTRDELEFSISQYLDGTLAAGEAEALEEVLARDAGARAMLAEERQLTALLRAASGPLPPVRWDALASRIGQAVAGAKIDVAAVAPTEARGRYEGNGVGILAGVDGSMNAGIAERNNGAPGDVMTPLVLTPHLRGARTGRAGGRRGGGRSPWRPLPTGRLALAASVLLAIGGALALWRYGPFGQGNDERPTPPVVVVKEIRVVDPDQSVVAQNITIGLEAGDPPSVYAGADDYVESPRPRVLISSTTAPAPEEPGLE